jgi:hypothetical protein
MEPLDLTKQPPRSPHEQINGLVMMARTVDKLRATLPGGNAGDYRMEGFSTRLLEHLDIQEDDLRAVVALAQSDDDVAAWLRKHTDPARYEAINRLLVNRTLADLKDRADFETRYPSAVGLPAQTPLFDVLERDDALLTR